MKNRQMLPVLLSSLLSSYALAAPDLSAPEALAAIQTGTLRIIDIRTPAEWQETGTVPGAGRVDFYRGPEVLTRYILDEVKGDKNAPIALICRTGNRTTHAQKYLQSLGFTRIYNVKEGMKGSAAGPGWLKRGLPLQDCRSC